MRHLGEMIVNEGGEYHIATTGASPYELRYIIGHSVVDRPSTPWRPPVDNVNRLKDLVGAHAEAKALIFSLRDGQAGALRTDCEWRDEDGCDWEDDLEHVGSFPCEDGGPDPEEPGRWPSHTRGNMQVTRLFALHSGTAGATRMEIPSGSTGCCI